MTKVGKKLSDQLTNNSHSHKQKFPQTKHKNK